MAVHDSSIDPKILDSARREFLAHGFKDTSLKQICQQAGVTTGALYKRYKGKEDLFAALVERVNRELEEEKARRASVDPAGLTDRELVNMWSMYNGSIEWWFDFLYARKDEFTLLLACSEGTRYANFAHQWVEEITASTIPFLEEVVRRGLAEHPVSPEELHVLLSSFWTAIYEPFLHSFTREQLDVHCRIICRMFNWAEILGMKEPAED